MKINGFSFTFPCSNVRLADGSLEFFPILVFGRCALRTSLLGRVRSICIVIDFLILVAHVTF